MCLLRPIESTPTEDGNLLAANAEANSDEAEQDIDEAILQ